MPRLEVNGIELHWDRYGDPAGTALVLLHGYTGSSHDFALQVDALSEHGPVITLDQRGHGLSTKTHDLASYTIDQLTDDLVGFIEHVADVPVDLLGHSMGGRVALGAVLARPDLVRSLILMDTSAWSFLPEDASVRALVSSYLDQFDPAQGMPSSFGLGSPEDLLIEAAITPEWRQCKDEQFAGLDAYAIKALGTSLFNGVESLRPQLATITMPTTVIVGSNDHPFIDQAPELAAEVANGQLSVIEGAYHSPQLTHPEQWRSAVLRHLAQCNA